MGHTDDDIKSEKDILAGISPAATPDNTMVPCTVLPLDLDSETYLLSYRLLRTPALHKIPAEHIHAPTFHVTLLINKASLHKRAQGRR